MTPIRWRRLFAGIAVSAAFLFAMFVIIAFLSMRGLDEGERIIQRAFVYGFAAFFAPLTLIATFAVFTPAFFIFRHINVTNPLHYVAWGAVVFGGTALLTIAAKPAGESIPPDRRSQFILLAAALGGLAGLFFWLGAVWRTAKGPVASSR